jgi:hypothetical protein
VELCRSADSRRQERKPPRLSCHEARAVGLLLHWPARLPNTILALTVAEWARRHEPRAFPALYAALF